MELTNRLKFTAIVLLVILTCIGIAVEAANEYNIGIASAYTLAVTAPVGTAPFTITSTTNVANLNASTLGGATFAAPGAIGGTTPAAVSGTTMKGTTYTTTTNCAANGTAANPSVVTCSSAAAGMFSCATNASTGTCQVNTTAVTANSEIMITQNQADGGASQLNVTCNTGLDLAAAAPILKTKAAGSSFTINLGTVTANPACFEYLIIN